MHQVSTTVDVALMNLCCYDRQNWSHHQQEIVCADCGATVDPAPPAEAIADALRLFNPDARILEPEAAFNKALIGLTTDPQDGWLRESGIPVAVYDYYECIQGLVEAGSPSWEAAVIEVETRLTAWYGEGTPTFVVDGEAVIKSELR